MQRPVWDDRTAREAYPSLERDLQVDVTVVGAGITGLTTAWLLGRAGYRVAVLEAGRVAGGATGATSAHLTIAIDGGYRLLERDLGEDGCRHLFHAGTDAIDLVEAFDRDEGVPGFQRVDAWHVSERLVGAQRLREEEEVLRQLGARCEPVPQAPVPWMNVGGYRLEGQALFHPIAHAGALARAIRRHGGLVFEHTRVVGWRAGAPVRVLANGRTVESTFLVLATHVPVGAVPSVQTRLLPRTTLLAAYELTGPVPQALVWDDDVPYHHLRPLSPDRPDLVLVGGGDHPTGRPDDAATARRRLDRWARDRLPVRRTLGTWSEQIFESADGLPFAGPLPMAPQVLVASGLGGQGLTLGTAAAQVIVDRIRGEPTRYGGLFDVGRLRARASVGTVARVVLATTARRLADRLRPAPEATIRTLAPGEGALVATGEGTVAAWRQPDGGVRIMSPVCSHAGCHVTWNAAASTWDSPCLGGRYHADGRVLSGPPLQPLRLLRLVEAPPAAAPTPRAAQASPEPEPV